MINCDRTTATLTATGVSTCNMIKVGDIVYFNSTYTAIYGCEGGSYEYYFKPGDRYRIDNINDGFGLRTGNITNLEDGKSHFAHSDIWKRMVTVEEWRELQLNKIGLLL